MRHSWSATPPSPDPHRSVHRSARQADHHNGPALLQQARRKICPRDERRCFSNRPFPALPAERRHRIVGTVAFVHQQEPIWSPSNGVCRLSGKHICRQKPAKYNNDKGIQKTLLADAGSHGTRGLKHRHPGLFRVRICGRIGKRRAKGGEPIITPATTAIQWRDYGCGECGFSIAWQASSIAVTNPKL